MGFAAFMNDPKTYLGHHRAMVQDAPASAQACIPAAGVVMPNGKTRIEFTQSPQNYISMIHTVGHGTPVHSSKKDIAKAIFGLGRIYRSFQPIASPADVGFRYLPFKANHCTYMVLDAYANFWITGPLTGCTVAVARHNGTLWVFHSNDNVGTGTLARDTQRHSLQYVCGAINVPYASLTRCEYQTHYHGFGFVFGRRRANSWKFYSHATDSNNNTRTIKWAEV